MTTTSLKLEALMRDLANVVAGEVMDCDLEGEVELVIVAAFHGAPNVAVAAIGEHPLTLLQSALDHAREWQKTPSH